ncbi:cbb3-type cytochrome c oxidase subunit III [Celeribacter persicus]|uniref:Cbb3-type cytochrome c oxidase subunit III n=2 Tax=Celeribacter persicus TaxID=1651082 RepID=A0A2T5HF22_9RHOB|nr:cbb3-type cytochrome c oxidase subunit III [Celeribacter persicus]
MRLLTTLTGAVALAMALLTFPVSAETPEELFEIHCAACHNSGGIGNPGLAPPLNRPAFWQALGDKAPEYIAGVVTSGMAGKLEIQGQMYIGLIMPPVASTTDEELVEIGTWVLQTLGETDGVLTQELLDTARETRPTHADLRAMRPAVD